MTIKFDPNRPFSAIFGDHGGARVSQDGHYFKADGTHIPELDPKPAKAEKPAKATPDPEPAPEPAPDPDDEPDDEPIPQPVPMGDPEAAEVDVKAWARGDIKVPWHILAEAVQARYSERPRNGEHARQIIAAG